ncbi:hypothetical protein B0A49_13573, partial [Cryomyces minteri]
MGKSNKFDYSTRGSQGVKLGEIVSKDLHKRAQTYSKKNKDQQAKTDPTVELLLNGRELTDAGMEKIAAGLLHPEVRQWRRLEVVNLSGNAITTNALAMLAPVVADARFELRDLDLSKNDIRVTTDEEAQDWELFLRSFEDCRTLRCLDLSDNPLGGSRAFEIMAR